jgi:acyl transferase domain-containing protein
MLYESNMSMLSPDSLSYSFDHRANGFSRGEGTVSLVIKRLSDAIRDGDTVRAVIRSTACNQNGRGVSSIMQPDVEAQAKLIHDTYAKAGLSMEPTRFFEAHGTGTSVGDPIEMNALGKAFQHVRDPDDPLIVYVAIQYSLPAFYFIIFAQRNFLTVTRGALKANIGHLEGASGLAAVIKVIMVLESGLIPPNANFEKINPKIDPELLGIQVCLFLFLRVVHFAFR